MNDIAELIKEKGGIRLDIGSGANVQEGFIGMDVRPLPGVDIVHDVNIHPWPLPSECVLLAVCSHLVEHIPPAAIRPDGSTWFPFVAFMDELWRVCKVGAEVAISLPHGSSQGFLQDPTHCNPCNERTWAYFDPDQILWTIYKPKPWRIKHLNWSPVANVEVALVKRAISEVDDAESE